ncbi:MAG: guanylate kinase [Clostridiales Family XIII bacterium]|jgi:guanylate kinase|nr:guanylate kinase [Clostridiales Family XIII bacterium]
MKRGILFVVSGPSGAGKGTICKELVRRTGIALSVSMTTRPPRRSEAEGREYIFVSREAFMEKISRNAFLEYAEVYGNYYGTPAESVRDILDSGGDVVLEIDVQGALKVKASCPESVSVFILPPSMGELRKRITARGTESDASISLRLGETLKEIRRVGEYDYCIVNDRLDEAVDRLAAIVVAENSRAGRGLRELVESYMEEM